MADVQVWQSQLMRNDFPPVCAVTGAPAEMWRKYTFVNTPGWAFLFGAIGAAAFSSRVSGYLPLTRRASKRITLWRWGFFALFGLAIVFWVAGALVVPSNASDSTRNGIALLLFFVGFASTIVGAVGLILGRSFVGPGARIKEIRGHSELLVELRRVHPAFVAGVQQLQQARAAQLQAAQAPVPAPPPASPFPPGKFSF